MKHDLVNRAYRSAMHRTSFAARSCALLLAAIALWAMPGTASAFTGGAQLFAWAERESAPIGQSYLPNSNYTPFGLSAAVAVTHEATGEYNVLFANHNPFGPSQSQVVAYGSDNTRCKFRKRADPFFSSMCRSQMGSSSGWCTRAYVLCTSPSGGPMDSKFAISFTGIAINNNPVLRGPAAFFETTGGGTGVAQSYDKFNGAVFPSLTPQYLNSVTPTFPRITRNFMGNYRVTIPGLGTSNPGLAQITALSPGATHCLTTLPAQSGPDIIFNVNCWSGTSRSDSDFIVNYDQVVTRQSTDHQGARAFADRPGSSFYTPSRSFNSGSVSFDPGSNTIIRLGTGAYAVDHTKLSAVNSSPWVGPFVNDGSYCKLRSWTPDFGSTSGVTLDVRCFNGQGSPSDTTFFETYQGPLMGPH